jgi:hypothetical protein
MHQGLKGWQAGTLEGEQAGTHCPDLGFRFPAFQHSSLQAFQRVGA